MGIFKPRSYRYIDRWREGAVKVYDGQETRWAIEEGAEDDRCPNSESGQHEWKTDCSYGDEFCRLCGRGHPDD